MAVASQVTPATAVTLDRVVCCYPFYERLLEQALRLAEQSIALSYPRDRWFVRLGIWLENALRRRRGNPFRTFVHPPLEMMRMIERAGFTLASRRRTLSWSSDVFVKPPDPYGPRGSATARISRAFGRWLCQMIVC